MPYHYAPAPPMDVAQERRIIPFRSDRNWDALSRQETLDTESALLQTHEDEQRLVRRPEEAGRHYLKFMLPAIPVTAFLMTFLYGYLLVGLRSPAATTTPVAPVAGVPGIDPTLPLVGALLLSLSTGMLCLIAYLGYQRVVEHAAGERDVVAAEESTALPSRF